MRKSVPGTEKKAGILCSIPGRESGPAGCTAEDHSLAAILKSIAHPVRIRILRMLADTEGTLCSCEIESRFRLRQPTISHHMKILRTSGLVESLQDGNWVRYSLARKTPVPLKQLLNGFSDL